MKKIVTTNKYVFNSKSLYIDGIRVKWDEKGVAEVEEDIANTLLANYPEVIFEEGFVVEQEEKKVESISVEYLKLKKENNSLLETIEDLRQKIALKDRLAEGADSAKKDVEADNKILRNELKNMEEKMTLILKENDELKKTISKVEKKEEDSDIKKKLSSKKVDELKSMCVELGIEEDIYSSLKKEELIDEILRNANN